MRRGGGVLLAAALLATGCGGAHSQSTTAPGRAAGSYEAKWEPVYRLDSSGRRVLSISRTTRALRLQVVDQTCHPNDPRFDPSRRFAGVTELEQRAAVVVTVHMHPEPPVAGCAPAGFGFPITVKLAHPLGARALVDGGTPRIGGGAPVAVIRVRARGRALERGAEAQYGRPDIPAVP